MEINMAIVNSVANINTIPNNKKPCYVLISDENHPQLIYFSKNDTPQKIPFNQHDYNRLALEMQVTEGIDKLTKSDQLSSIVPLSENLKETIQRITGHRVADLSQSNLIDRVNYYLEINKYDLRMNQRGVCQGLAAVYCKYVTENKEKKFFEFLERIATTKYSAFKTPDLELNTFIQETVFAFNPGVFNKNLGQGYSLENIRVQNPNISDKSSQNANLKKAFKFNAATTGNQWESILSDIKLEGASYLIAIPRHAIAMSYRENKFHLYDPNYEEGEKIFSSEHEVLKEIAKTITVFNIADAIRDIEERAKIKLSLSGKPIEIKYEDNKYFLYDDPIHPDSFKEYGTLDDLVEYTTNTLIDEKNFMFDMSISVAENPYYPIHYQFPDKHQLLNTLIQARKDYDEDLTLSSAMSENDAELADEFLANLIDDPNNSRLVNFLLDAFKKNAHVWLTKILDHPKISANEQIKKDVMQQLLQNDKYIGNDKSLKILLEHPSFQSIYLSTSKKALFLQYAIFSENPKSVDILLKKCSQQELAMIISKKLISQAVEQGRVDVLELLLNVKQIDARFASICFLAALNDFDFKMAHYLLNKYPEHKLDQRSQFMHFDKDQEIKFLKRAIGTKNESNVKLVLNMFQDKFEIIKECFAEAILSNNLGVINYLIEKSPKNSLKKLYSINYEMIEKYDLNPKTVLLLLENGVKFVDTKPNRIKFSVYAYSFEQTPESLSVLRPSVKSRASADTINFIVNSIEDEKMSVARLFQDILANNDVLLGVDVIKELATRKVVYASRCEAIQNFMSQLIEQKNNAELRTLLNIEPPLPLDYLPLYEKAKIVKTMYEKDKWPVLTYFAKPDKKILLQLKEYADQQQLPVESIPAYPLSMLKMKTVPVAQESPDKSIVSDASNENASLTLEAVKGKAPVIESSSAIENEDVSEQSKGLSSRG